MSTGFSPSLVNSPRGNYKSYQYRSKMGIIPSFEFDVLHDDFNRAISSNLPVGWTAAIIDTGATLTADTTATHSSTVIAQSDDASEGVSIYLPKNIQLTSGKRFFLEARIKTTTAADADFQIGLTDLTATTNPEDLYTTTAANLVAFGVLAGSAATKMLSDKSNGGTTVQTGTRSLVDATWHTIAIEYTGVQLKGYVDGKASLTWSGASTTIPTATALSPFIGFRNGTAGAANKGYIDYFRYVAER